MIFSCIFLSLYPNYTFYFCDYNRSFFSKKYFCHSFLAQLMLHFVKNNRRIYLALFLVSIYLCGSFFTNILHPLSHTHDQLESSELHPNNEDCRTNHLKLTFSHSCFLCHVIFSETTFVKFEYISIQTLVLFFPEKFSCEKPSNNYIVHKSSRAPPKYLS